MGLALEADSSEVSNPESTGVESDSSMGAATKAVVFWNHGLNTLFEACRVVLFWGVVEVDPPPPRHLVLPK